MTVILAVKDKVNRKIYMAGDRMVSNGMTERKKLPHPKIHNKGGILYGATGSSVYCSGFAELLKLPKLKRGQSITQYMFGVLRPAIKEVADAQFYFNYENSYFGALFVVEQHLIEVVVTNDKDAKNVVDIHVGLNDFPYSVGCGSKAVLAAYEALKDERDIKTRIMKAMKATYVVDAACGRGTDLLELDY